jgi:hypothetical protein
LRKLFIFFAFSFVITNMFCMESFGAPELFSGAPELFRRMNIVTRAQRSVDQKFETFSSYEQQLNADMKKRQNFTIGSPFAQKVIAFSDALNSVFQDLKDLAAQGEFYRSYVVERTKDVLIYLRFLSGCVRKIQNNGKLLEELVGIQRPFLALNTRLK